MSRVRPAIRLTWSWHDPASHIFGHSGESVRRQEGKQEGTKTQFQRLVKPEVCKISSPPIPRPLTPRCFGWEGPSCSLCINSVRLGLRPPGRAGLIGEKAWEQIGPERAHNIHVLTNIWGLLLGIKVRNMWGKLASRGRKWLCGVWNCDRAGRATNKQSQGNDFHSVDKIPSALLPLHTHHPICPFTVCKYGNIKRVTMMSISAEKKNWYPWLDIKLRKTDAEKSKE